MRAGRVLLISAVAHGGLFALLAQIAVRGPTRAVIEKAPPVPDEPAPIEVVMIDPPAEPGSTARPPSDARAQNADRSKGLHPSRTRSSPDSDPGVSGVLAVVPSASEPTSETGHGGTGNGTGAGTGAGTGLMRMRGTELGLDPGVATRIAEAGARPLVDGPTISGKLENVPGGGAVVHDRVTTMTVERDGTARFHDKPDMDLRLKLPIPHLDVEGMRKDLGKALTDWFADPYAGTRYGRTQDLARHLQAVPGACDGWGSVWCDDPLAPDSERYAREQKQTNGSILGGNGDITAYLHRKLVGDPYASRKLKLLDDTREERIARGEVFRGEQLERAPELVLRNLERMWASTTDPIARKALLFEIWDECGEGEGRDGEAGQRARAIVIGWIRTHLPRGTDSAYTDEEVAALAARRSSKQPFLPY